MVNKPFLKSLNTTLIRNIKIYQKKLINFFYKKFLKIFSKLIILKHLLTFPSLFFFFFLGVCAQAIGGIIEPKAHFAGV